MKKIPVGGWKCIKKCCQSSQSPVLKIFKHFKSVRVWSLGVGFWCYILVDP